jgi:DNA-binding protein HU-beta
MRKADRVRCMAKAADRTQVKAEEVVDVIFEAIKEALQQGDSVILRRFGSFQIRDQRARIGRPPKPGQEAEIPARRVVRFKAGKAFKDAVKGSTP